MRYKFTFFVIVILKISLLHAIEKPPKFIDASISPLAQENIRASRTSKELEEGLRDGSIALSSLRDSGEHILACTLLNKIGKQEEERALQSPRGKKAYEIIDELNNNYVPFRNTQAAAHSLEHLEALVEELKRLHQQRPQKPQSLSNPAHS